MKKFLIIALALLCVFMICSCSPEKEVDATSEVVMLDFGYGTVKGITGFADSNVFLKMRAGGGNDPSSEGFWMAAGAMQSLPIIPALKKGPVPKQNQNSLYHAYGFPMILKDVQENKDGVFFRYYILADESAKNNPKLESNVVGQIDYYYAYPTEAGGKGKFSYREIITPFLNYLNCGDNIFVFELLNIEVDPNDKSLSFNTVDKPFQLINFVFRTETGNGYTSAEMIKYDIMMKHEGTKTYSTVFDKCSKEGIVGFTLPEGSQIIEGSHCYLDNSHCNLGFALNLIKTYVTNIDETLMKETFTSFSEFSEVSISGNGLVEKEKGIYHIFAYDVASFKGAMLYSGGGVIITPDQNFDNSGNPELKTTNGTKQEFEGHFEYPEEFPDFMVTHLIKCGIGSEEAAKDWLKQDGRYPDLFQTE